MNTKMNFEGTVVVNFEDKETKLVYDDYKEMLEDITIFTSADVPGSIRCEFNMENNINTTKLVIPDVREAYDKLYDIGEVLIDVDYVPNKLKKEIFEKSKEVILQYCNDVQGCITEYIQNPSDYDQKQVKDTFDFLKQVVSSIEEDFGNSVDDLKLAGETLRELYKELETQWEYAYPQEQEELKCKMEVIQRDIDTSEFFKRLLSLQYCILPYLRLIITELNTVQVSSELDVSSKNYFKIDL